MLILPEFIISGLRLFQSRVVDKIKFSPACICGHGFEDCIHFFLECSFYNENRAILLNKSKNYVVTIELIRKKDRKKKKGFKQTKTTKNNMDWSE
jgi:hypothetical protein